MSIDKEQYAKRGTIRRREFFSSSSSESSSESGSDSDSEPFHFQEGQVDYFEMENPEQKTFNNKLHEINSDETARWEIVGEMAASYHDAGEIFQKDVEALLQLWNQKYQNDQTAIRNEVVAEYDFGRFHTLREKLEMINEKATQDRENILKDLRALVIKMHSFM